MRAEKSIRNVIFAWGTQVLQIIMGFVGRTIFIHILSEEYLGLNGLFSNILTMLSLAELGIGTAIVFSLYKPIAEKDQPQILALMRFYRKFYQAVGCFVLVVGSLLTPVLPHLIKEMPDIPHIYLIYLMYVLNTGVSYFFSYKAAFINANQENFIVSLNYGICNVVMVGSQMIVLTLTRNFLAYFSVQIIMTLVSNSIISYIANRRYPFLKSKEIYHIPPATSKQIRTNTLAMIGHNVGTIVMNSTDNLIISRFVGLAEVGLYSNYLMILNSVSTVLNQAFSAITASVGNLLILGEEQQKENTLYMVFFIDFWLYSFSAIAIACLANPFIELWVGEKYLYTIPVVFTLAAKFYCTGIRQTCCSFKSAAGLYMQDVFKPYVEVVLNIALSLVLVQHLGILGVFLGTLITTVLVSTWIEPLIVFRNALNKNPWGYYVKYLWYVAVTLATGTVTYLICDRIVIGGFAGFVLKVIVVAIVPNVIIFVVSVRSREFRMLLDTLQNVAANRKKGSEE